MKKSMVNESVIEGVLYQHSLEERVSGPASAHPGTPYIAGTIDIATDNNITNIVSVHFSYVTEAFGKSKKANPNYPMMKKIISGQIGTYIDDGIEGAAKLRIRSSIVLNEFFSDKTGQEELVSTKRNEGGFITVVDELNPDEKKRNTFKCDMLVTKAIRHEPDEERGTPEKMTIKGAIFDFRNSLLPVTFSVTKPNAMDYFESLELSEKNPLFTQLWGIQISETIKRTIVTESAFGDDDVNIVTSSRKDFVVTGANKEPYSWDDPATMTIAELNEAITARNVYLATLKAKNDEWKASQANNQNNFSGATTPTASMGGFKF